MQLFLLLIHDLLCNMAAAAPAVSTTTFPSTREQSFVPVACTVEKSHVPRSNPPDYLNVQNIQTIPFYTGTSAEDYFREAAAELAISGHFRSGVWT